MIIGFGFGSPLVSLLMLLGTSLASYFVYRMLRSRRHTVRPSRAGLRRYYYEQRQRAKSMAEEFDLTDEDIERKIDEEIGREP